MSDDRTDYPDEEGAALGDGLARGLANRRRLLGDAWVDRAIASADELTVDFQRMVTCYVWDGIWSRPGLDPHTRRLLVLTTMAALGRWEEFELHVRAGLTAPPDDPARAPIDVATLREILLQVAVYAGVPVGNTGLAVVRRVLESLDRKPAGASLEGGA